MKTFNVLGVFVLFGLFHALAQPVINGLAVDSGNWTHPIAIVPGPPFEPSEDVADQTLGTEVILNITDLQTSDLFAPGYYPGPNPSADWSNIHGNDDRHTPPEHGDPWDYIGLWAYWKDGYRHFCSASLVGPRHLATARHCFLGFQSGLTYTFWPNLRNGQSGKTARAIKVYTAPYGTSGTRCDYESDWAVVLLDKRLGDEYGYFGVRNFNVETQIARPMFLHQGYPADRGEGLEPFVQGYVSATTFTYCYPNGPLATNADADNGQSGGPLWAYENGNNWLYGVASTINPNFTMFAGRRVLVDAVIGMRKDFP